MALASTRQEVAGLQSENMELKSQVAQHLAEKNRLETRIEYLRKDIEVLSQEQDEQRISLSDKLNQQKVTCGCFIDVNLGRVNGRRSVSSSLQILNCLCNV